MHGTESWWNWSQSLARVEHKDNRDWVFPISRQLKMITNKMYNTSPGFYWNK